MVTSRAGDHAAVRNGEDKFLVDNWPVRRQVPRAVFITDQEVS
jgi:hypothetical protein